MREQAVGWFAVGVAVVGIAGCGSHPCGCLDAAPRRDVRVIDAAVDRGRPDTLPPTPDSTPVDAGPPDACVGLPCIPPPRAIAPLSTAGVTSHQPTLTFALAAGTAAAQVDLCTSRTCTTGLTLIGTSSVTPPSPLASGVWYWRLHGCTTDCLSGDVGTRTSPFWQLTVGAAAAPVATSWGTTPDFNGDGYADVVVGDNTTAAVYPGSPAGIASTEGLTITPPTGTGFAVPLACAGDVNGDGFPDLFIAAPSAAYVYFGSRAGLPTTPSQTLAAPSGAGVGTHANAGDVNGDGYADVVLGDAAVKSAFVYFGSASGLGAAPSQTLTGPPSASDFGDPVASAGDVNGDGFGDVAVGSWEAAQAFVFLGSASGLGATPIALAGASGSAFGQTFAGADFDDDGYTDLAVGALLANEVVVFKGGAGGTATTPAITLMGGTGDELGAALAPAGDLNQDGYADLAVGGNKYMAWIYEGSPSGLPSTATTVLSGPAFGFGGAVAGAGDVNDDGPSDLLIGSPDSSTTFLYLGSASGLAGVTPTTLTGPASSFFGSYLAFSRLAAISGG